MAKVFNSKECQREFNLYRKKVARLNAYIEDVIKKVGNNEVYLDKSSTIVSAPASVWPIYECPPEPGKEFCEFNGMPSLEFRQRYQWPEYSKDANCVMNFRDGAYLTPIHNKPQLELWEEYMKWRREHKTTF